MNIVKLNSRKRHAGKKRPLAVMSCGNAKLGSKHAGLGPVLMPKKLDLGCGANKRPDFCGVDVIDFPGVVDVVCNLAEPQYEPLPTGYQWMDKFFERKIVGYKPWPWENDIIEEVHCSHFVEHLDRKERCHFFNELWRVMKVGAKATIITPHWSSCRAYGDPTHQWPPNGEFGLFYLNKNWRDTTGNAPHTDRKHLSWGYNCNFDVTWGFSVEPGVAMRDQNYQTHALTYWKEAAQDLISTITKIA